MATDLARAMPYIVTSLDLRELAETAQALGGYPVEGWLLHMYDLDEAARLGGLCMSGAPIRAGQREAPAPGQMLWLWMGMPVVVDRWVQPGTVEFRSMRNAPQRILAGDAVCECGHYGLAHAGRPLYGVQADGTPWMPEACTTSFCPCTRFHDGV